jgi:3',5'-cyclic AMP phosphodiesterase CpdA
LLTLVAAASIGVIASPPPSMGSSETEGRSTVRQRILADAGVFKSLRLGPGERYAVREDGLGAARPGRSRRRRSLIYFGQLSDFQLVDEESPGRVEPADRRGPPFTSAWRPQEALGPFAVDAAIQQMNLFVAASPVRQASGERARMALAVTTGDSADNKQLNETEWVVRLLEGGPLDPNSGSGNPAHYSGCLTGTPDPAEAPRYTGVQDYEDYGQPDGEYYDPDQPFGPRFATWPRYPGLMDRAQRPFVAAGLAVPTYAVFGNHDGLVQGNAAASRAFEDLVLGCGKVINRTTGITVPPDPRRRFVSKAQYKALHRTSSSRIAHGFGLVDPAEEAASRGNAGYYAWTPARGLRFIALDTVSEGGVAEVSSDGNLDDPQYRWLERELQAATRRDQLVVLFSHHAIPSFDAAVADEAAPPCGLGDDGHGHDRNPGCDLDPRLSTPIHTEADMPVLLHRYPHVIAWVAGHSHENVVEPYRSPNGRSGFWSIRTASEVDWPQQNRLVELMDNQDGTLSIFGTMLDHTGPVPPPRAGTPAGGLGTLELASISRSLAANDPQKGAPGGEGTARSRNVELMIGDPRRNPLREGRRCASLRGRISGRRLHRARLGRRRSAIRRAYPRSSRRTRGRFDLFCLADGKLVRVGYPSRGLLRGLPRRERRRVRGRAVLILTSSGHFRAKRVPPGMRVRTMRRRVRDERRFRIGRNTWYLARGRGATVVYRTQRGRVRAIGLADRRLTGGRRAARRFLRGFNY